MKLPEMTKRNQLLLVLALIVIAIPSLFIFDYTQNNPKFCTTCHLMNEAYNTWEASAMHDLNCHSCHEATMAQSMQHVYDVLTHNPQDVTKPVEIENDMCETCHASNDDQWLQVVNTAGHAVHLYNGNAHAECIECHGMELHVFRPPHEPCLECHEPERVHASETMNADCTTCHDFLAEEDDLTPVRDDCIECHEEKELLVVSMPAETHLDSTCTSCHDPHGEVTAEDCTKCHTDVDEGLHEISAHTVCTSCHVPHEEVAVRDSCESCHVDKEEHYAPVNCLSCHE